MFFLKPQQSMKHLLLLVIATLVAISASAAVSLEVSTTSGADSTTIFYRDAPAGACISVHKHPSVLAMRPEITVGEHGKFGMVTFALDPGTYTATCTSADGSTLAAKQFSIAEPKVSGTRIVVLSDTHTLAPSLIKHDGKALQSAENGDFKLVRQSAEVLTSLIDSIKALHPALVLITGDLTYNGEAAAHQFVASQLQALDQAGIKCLVIPGNHDCNNPYAHYFDGDKTTPAPTVTRAQFAQIYSHAGYGEGSQRDTASLSYACEPIDGLVVIGIDSNRDEENRLTSRGDSSDLYHNAGRVKPQTLAWVAQQAKAAHRQGKRVIAMMHHHLLEHFDKEADLTPNYIVAAHDTVADALMRCGISAVLTGHFHATDIARAHNASGTDSIFDIATGSVVTYPNYWRVLTLAPDGQLSVVTRQLTATPSCPQLQATSRQTIEHNAPAIMRSMTSRMWPKLQGKIKRIPFAGQLLKLPDNSADMADTLITRFGGMAAQAYLTFLEGNEGQKATDALISAGKAEINDYASAVTRRIIRGKVLSMLSKSVMPRIEPLIISVLHDVNAADTTHPSVTNDLFLTLPLK